MRQIWVPAMRRKWRIGVSVNHVLCTCPMFMSILRFHRSNKGTWVERIFIVVVSFPKRETGDYEVGVEIFGDFTMSVRGVLVGLYCFTSMLVFGNFCWGAHDVEDIR